jgi:hypothetical protein
VVFRGFAGNITLDVMSAIRDAIEEMAKSLAPVDRGSAAHLRQAASRSAQEIADDLNIWGGAGSLMDQSHTPDPLKLRSIFERGAIQLAQALVAAGATNSRMEWWASRASPPASVQSMTSNMAADADVLAARCRVPMVHRSLLR